MSGPAGPVVMSVILELRHFQVLVMQDGAAIWFATISERGDGRHQTRALGSIETPAGPAAALHLALDQILQTVGIEQQAAPAGEQP